MSRVGIVDEDAGGGAPRGEADTCGDRGQHFSETVKGEERAFEEGGGDREGYCRGYTGGRVGGMWTDVENEGSRIVGPETNVLWEHGGQAERNCWGVLGWATGVGGRKRHEGCGGRGSGGGEAGSEQSTRAKAVGNRSCKTVAGTFLGPVVVQDGLRWISSNTEKIHGRG